ncbi:uncharacterized protein LOC108250224 isoform X2 [Kryptolebias marmoratus]|uniref:uncharacterized protein LOC108250224 isoform X2 n=1 Tax=Kryptolebias marmoratus TaxID=37003 RepID=UPI0007F8B6BC|nr:uncharacterized protein LOC108250224 isoform X2 [Kryptolebias marmoratus]
MSTAFVNQHPKHQRVNWRKALRCMHHLTSTDMKGVKPGPVGKMVVVKPVQGRLCQGGLRSTLFRGMTGPLPDLSVLRVAEVYSDLDPLEKLLVTTMGMSVEKPLVDSEFGLVQKGSVLSYQQPKRLTRCIELHQHAPPPPSLPLFTHHLSPAECIWVCTEEEHFHLQSLQLSLDVAHKIETSTRAQSYVHEWHMLRQSRITSSRFREVCRVRGHHTAESLAERIIRGTKETAKMRRGSDMEFQAAKEYTHHYNVNYSPCGLVIHPEAPWLGASPDDLVFDPRETPSFGLVEIKCPNVKSYVDCKYLQITDGIFKLKKTHPYYCQVQGQLLITGLMWCDFFVWAEEDLFVQRLDQDMEVQKIIRQKCDHFYFNIYMQKYLSMRRAAHM